MTAEAALFVRSFKVGARTVTLTVQRPRRGGTSTMVFDWKPDLPERLTDAEMDQYRAGRNAAIAELSELLGMRTLVVEL